MRYYRYLRLVECSWVLVLPFVFVEASVLAPAFIEHLWIRIARCGAAQFGIVLVSLGTMLVSTTIFEAYPTRARE